MGKRRGGNRKRGGGGGGRDDRRDTRDGGGVGNRGPNQRSDEWADSISSESTLLSQFYKAQDIVPETEWDAFMKTMKEPLPTTFRVTSSREVAPRLNKQIEETFVPFLTGIEYEGEPLEAPKKLEWYPGGFAWQLNVPRQAIRKQDAFRKFQHFLVHEADCGNLSRQEAVSMVPPLFMDVEPHHHVLDMCAAPGSKTVQLLEALSGGQAGIERDGKGMPEGLLIANDSDAKRCHLLVHQSLHRVPGAGMMVTNHDATQLPGLRLPNSEAEIQAEPDRLKKKYRPLLFDRILADVPCSGDGTLRKNIAIWREFSPGNGTGLHSLQLRILLRGIALLKSGGRLVYSTCSMNPVENEAVVSAALQLCPEMSIVDVSDQLPHLKRRPGKTDWLVLDNQCNPAPHPDHPIQAEENSSTTATEGETATDQTKEKPTTNRRKQKTWTKTLWPSGKEKELGLEKAMRIYGHLQDTGSFFVCVLQKATEESQAESNVIGTASTSTATTGTVNAEKKKETKRSAEEVEQAGEAKKAKSETADEEIQAEDDEENIAPAPVSVPEPDENEVNVSSLPDDVVGGNVFTRKQNDFKEEPFIYLNPDDEQVKLCAEFFDLSPDFPLENLLVRNAQGMALRSIYCTSPATRSLLLANSFQRMRLISCGVKIFARQDSSKDGTFRCKWRVMSEGLAVLRPFMGSRRVVQGSVPTLKTLMSSLNVGLESLEEVALRERLQEMEPGSCVIEVDAKGDGLLFEQRLTLPFWKSKNTVTLMVEKIEKSALSLRLFGEDVTPHRAAPKARDTARAGAEANNSGDVTPAAEAEVEAENAESKMDSEVPAAIEESNAVGAAANGEEKQV